MDRLGAGLPILLESDTERQFEATSETMKHHVDTRRMERSKCTRRLEGNYRHLQKRITSYISHLVKDKKLPYSTLKRWVYSLRFDLKARIPERNPGVEKMLNAFYSQFYDTERLKELMVKVDGHLTTPPTVKRALQTFEDEVDAFLSSRVFLDGFNECGEQNAMFCVDPEWSVYPACDLYQIHKRVREALQRIRGELYVVILFCTVLTEYVVLSSVESFAQKMKERVERHPTCIHKPDATSLSSEEAADNPSRYDKNESVNVEDQQEVDEGQSKFPCGSKILGNGHSVFVPGIEWVPSTIVSSLASEGGWSSFEYTVPTDGERGPLLISCIKYFYSPSP